METEATLSTVSVIQQTKTKPNLEPRSLAANFPNPPNWLFKSPFAPPHKSAPPTPSTQWEAGDEK